MEWYQILALFLSLFTFYYVMLDVMGVEGMGIKGLLRDSKRLVIWLISYIGGDVCLAYGERLFHRSTDIREPVRYIPDRKIDDEQIPKSQTTPEIVEQESELQTSIKQLDLSIVAQSDNLLIIGPKGSGKTTLMTYILIQRYGDCLVLDPHGSPGKWPCLMIGSGRSWPGIKHALKTWTDFLQSRSEDLASGRTKEKEFPRVTVISDEWNTIQEEIDIAGDCLKKILREGRKFGLAVITTGHTDTNAGTGLHGNKNLLRCYDYILFMGGLAVKKAYDPVIRGFVQLQDWKCLAYDPEMDEYIPVTIPQIVLPSTSFPEKNIPENLLPFIEESTQEDGYSCPHCGSELPNAQAERSAKWRGYCVSCKS